MSCNRTTFGSCGLIRGMPVMARIFSLPRSSKAIAAALVRNHGARPGNDGVQNAVKIERRSDLGAYLDQGFENLDFPFRLQHAGVVQGRGGGLRDGVQQEEIVFRKRRPIPLVDGFD